MNSNASFQVRRPAARIGSGVIGAVIGLGVIALVVQGLGGRSHGQSLGAFMAQQRAIATNPLVQAAPAETTTPESGAAATAADLI
jgi:hypothetical protein